MSLVSDWHLESLMGDVTCDGKIVPIFITLTVVLLLLNLSCGLQLLDYSLDTPATTLSVLGAPSTKDGRARFRQILCDRLAADPELATRRDDLRNLPASSRRRDQAGGTGGTPPSTVPRLRLLIVPGFMGAFYWDFAKPFEVSAARLNDRGYRIDWIVVDGRSGSEHNGGQIADAVRRMDLEEDESLVLVRHSKGAVDILDFLVSYPDLAPRVVAVVRVSGAIMARRWRITWCMCTPPWRGSSRRRLPARRRPRG